MTALATRSTRPRQWDVALVVAAGGAVGGLMRHAVNQVLPADGFPWSTVAENVAGAFLLALLLVHVLEVWPPSRYVRPFLGVGVLGGFTTFSTFSAQTRGLLAAGRPGLALANVGVTLAAGLAATWLGLRLARRRVRRRR